MTIQQLSITAKSLILSVIFLFSIQLKAQNYHFDSYGVKEGLAQSSVYAVQQDKEGYVWLGTASGLSRFDGINFINYTTENGLADGAVKAIHIDSSGVIWIGHNGGGISKYNKDTIEIVFNLGADITSFNEDQGGNLWVSSYKEGAIKITNPYHLNKDSLVIDQYKGQEGLSDLVFQVYTLRNGQTCFVTDVGIKQFDYQKNEFKAYKVKDMPAYFQTICMLESSNGDRWFGSHNGGLYHYIKKEARLKTYDEYRNGIASNFISFLKEGRDGTIWVGSWGGGLTCIKNDELLTIDNSKGLTDNYIRYINEDREGNILLGTKENGLLIYKGNQFVSYGVDNGLVDEQVWSILSDDEGQNWFGTRKGIAVFKENALRRNYTENNGLRYTDVRFIKKDNNDNIWIGTYGGGVLQLNGERFESNDLINSEMSQPIIKAMDIDQSNNLWVGTTDGLVYYEIDHQLVGRVAQEHGLAGNNEITAIYTDTKNTVWVGSLGNGLTKIINDKISKVELAERITPTCFIEDKTGNLWIGTEGKGVIVIDKKQKITNKYTVNSGLLSNYVSLLNVDDKGNVWVGTNKGLNRFDVEEGRFYMYAEKLGYTGIESKNNATFKDKNGDIWFGTVAGAIKMNAKEVRDNRLETLTRITRFRVNLEDREMLPDLELNYQEKSVTFDFTSICLTNPEEVYYQVMLEGADAYWRPVSQLPYITYQTLPPGAYKFKVKARNNEGIWNEVPTTYSFKIIPPLWERPWFIILCLILVIFAVMVFINFREKKLIKEKKILEDKVEERTEEVVQKSEELEQKNKDIIDSITYAKRIQKAILPAKAVIEESLPESFVLYIPKDIIAGDFYWIEVVEDITFYAAADCTGHGVPGAMVSIVCNNGLNRSVREYGLRDPAKILDKTRELVLQEFEKSEEDVKDGMDIGLCSLNRKTNELMFAGAYNPVYIIRDQELIEIKGDKQPVGKHSKNAPFTSHTFQLQKGDTVYTFTDGYADQFGGPKGKKFMYKPFKRLLMDINNEPLDVQKQILNKAFEDWKGEEKQLDDVCVFGIRI